MLCTEAPWFHEKSLPVKARCGRTFDSYSTCADTAGGFHIIKNGEGIIKKDNSDGVGVMGDALGNCEGLGYLYGSFRVIPETRFASGSAQTIRDDGRQLKSENKSARQGAVILKDAAYCGM